MEMNTNLLYPILVLFIGLFLEYWVIQPLRNKSANKQFTSTDEQEKQNKAKELLSKLLFIRPANIFISGFIFFALTIVYFLYVYPFYQTYYQQFFYDRIQLSFSGTDTNNIFFSEDYVLNTPTYVGSGQKAKIDVQIENKTDVFVDNINIRIVARYKRYSSTIPFTESEPLEAIFESIAPKSVEYTTVTYTTPKNLINGDLIELTFYRNNKQISYGYSSYPTSRIYVHSFNGFIILLFEGILFTPWVNLLLFLIAVISAILATLEYRPPQDSARTISGLLYTSRIVIRASALIILLIGFSASALTHYPQPYMLFSIFALPTYIPFKDIRSKIMSKTLRSNTSKRRK